MPPKIFDYPQENGVIADGAEQLQQQAIKHPMARQALDRAFEDKDADPQGTLVQDEKFGLENYYSALEGSVSLIPSKFKRYLVGFAGAIGSFMIMVLGIGLSTRFIPRIFRWLRDGFKA